MKDEQHRDGISNAKEVDVDRRRVLMGTAAVAAVGVAGAASSASAATEEAREKYADPAEPALPPIDMEIDPERTALVVVDPQIDFLSPEGTAWGVVGNSVTEQQTVPNLVKLFKAAKASDMPVFISPHYYYPWDNHHKFGGPLEKVMHNLPMFVRKGAGELEVIAAESTRTLKPGHVLISLVGPERLVTASRADQARGN